MARKNVQPTPDPNQNFGQGEAVAPTEAPGVPQSPEAEAAGQAPATYSEQAPVTYTEAAPVYTVDNQQVALSYAEQQQMAQKKKKRRNVIIGVIIGVVVVAALVVAFLMLRRASAQTSASDYVTAQAQTGSIEKTISGSGQLQAATTSEVSAKVSGTVTDLSVKLGSEVTTGTVLFKVDDNGTLADAVTSASNSLSSAKLSLTSAEQSLKSAQAASTTTAAELMAQSKSGTSQSNTGSSSLGSGSGMGQNKTGGSSSTSSSTSSSGALTPAQAKAQAAQANAQRAAAIASAQAQVKQAQAQVTSAQSDYDTAVKNAGETAVTAPATGIVTALNVSNGDSVTGSSSSASSNNNSSNNNSSNSSLNSLLGNSSNSSNNSSSNSSSSSSAVEISDYSSAMTADISVSESDISSVQKGQGVNLSFSAFPSLEASGTVTQISPTGTSSGSLVDFTVTMTLKDPDKQLRPGMSVTAEIVTASAKNVLLVPNTAIDQASDGTYTVRVAQNGDTTNLKTVTVTVGVANDSYTEIKSGLTAGEVVISGTTSSSSSTSSSSGGMFSLGGGMRTNGGGGGTYRSIDSGQGGNPGGGQGQTYRGGN